MAVALVDPQLGKRNVLARAAKRLREEASSVFEPSEQPRLFREKLGLGYWLGVRSLRDRQIFELVEKGYFNGFQGHSFFVDDELWSWIRFGYDHCGRIPQSPWDSIALGM